MSDTVLKRASRSPAQPLTPGRHFPLGKASGFRKPSAVSQVCLNAKIFTDKAPKGLPVNTAKVDLGRWHPRWRGSTCEGRGGSPSAPAQRLCAGQGRRPAAQTRVSRPLVSRRVRPLPPRPQDRGKGFKYARLQNARTKQRTQCLGKHRSSRGLSRWPPEQPSPGRGGGGCGGSGHQGLPRARPHRLCRSLLWPLPQHPAGAHQAPLLSRSPPPLWGQERAGHTHRPGVGAQPAGQTRPQPRRHTAAFTGSHTCITLANTHTRGRT